MEIEKMTIEELEARRAEIDVEIDAEDADLDALAVEARAIKEEMEKRKAAEAKKVEIRKAVAQGAGVVIDKPEEAKEERKTEMTDKEIRSSKEYLDAWVEYQKGRASEEQRALLTENATGGTIAVPVYVENIIHTAWENNELVRRVRKTNFPGNLKVGVEVSSEGPYVHTEGDEAISEENLVLRYISLIPEMFKKKVRYSDEVLAMAGSAFADYVVDEIEYQIVKSLGDNLIDQIVSDASGIVAESTMAGATLTTADVVTAEGLLGGEATNLVLITSRANAAALKAAALSAGYGFDPFDGMDVIYADAAILDSAEAIIADPSGLQINLPEGDSVKFKVDDITEADADMIRVIGRIYAALGVVAYGKIVRIVGE